ncbi:MAG: HD-GYP domain-containing protein [Planctomycetota bacterium]|jgi:HD-GYP domain-containing protein (c-di-GMP phosphodiesterase class II)
MSGARKDFDRQLHQTASRFLSLFDSAVRQAQLYEPENRIMNEPIARLRESLERLTGSGAGFSFQEKDDSIFINGERLRCDGTAFTRHVAFGRELESRKIEGMLFQGPLDDAEWKALVYAIARFERESDTPFEDIRDALQEEGLGEKVELTVLGKEAQLRRLMKMRTEGRMVAARAYAKAMQILKLFVRHLDNPTWHGYYHLKLQRAVQDLVSVCKDHGWKYIGLVHNDFFEEYLYNHSVNVTILALAMGVRLNLKRTRLTELGTAAMLHDLGKALLPKELMEKRGPFTDEERAQLNEHPVLGVGALLKLRHYNEALLKRIMVMCEHHRTFTQDEKFHAYSRIVAIAETFDALTSHRPYRPAFLPDEAIRILISLAGKRLDESLVHIFVRTVGLYPPGTLLLLSTGEKAIAFHPHPEMEKWKTPVARIVRDKKGKEVKEAMLVDLSEEVEDYKLKREIVRTLDPAAEGINVTGYLYSERDESQAG